MGCGASASVDKDRRMWEHRAAQQGQQAAKRRLEEDYTVQQMIGRGHYGAVYKGTQRKTGKAVAIKMVERAKSRPERLELEVSVLRAVGKHPNAVELIDVYEAEAHVCLVMELVTGGELFERIVEKGALTEHRAASVCRKIAAALRYMHKRGVVHRDLKPENVLLTAEGGKLSIKVADFGLSRFFTETDSPMRTVCGTWAYSAPEVRIFRKGYTEKVDLWSLGVLLFVCLSGYHPFDPEGTANEEQLQNAIKHAQYSFDDPVWHRVSEDAKDLIRRLIVVDPDVRLSAKEVLMHPFVAGKSKGKTRGAQSFSSRGAGIPGSTSRGSIRSTGASDSDSSSEEDHVLNRSDTTSTKGTVTRLRRARNLSSRALNTQPSRGAIDFTVAAGAEESRAAPSRKPSARMTAAATPKRSPVGSQPVSPASVVPAPTPRSQKPPKRPGPPPKSVKDMHSDEVLEGGGTPIVDAPRAPSPSTGRRKNNGKRDVVPVTHIAAEADPKARRRQKGKLAEFKSGEVVEDSAAPTERPREEVLDGLLAEIDDGGIIEGTMAPTHVEQRARLEGSMASMESGELVIRDVVGEQPPDLRTHGATDADGGYMMQALESGELVAEELAAQDAAQPSTDEMLVDGAMAEMESGELVTADVEVEDPTQIPNAFSRARVPSSQGPRGPAMSSDEIITAEMETEQVAPHAHSRAVHGFGAVVGLLQSKNHLKAAMARIDSDEVIEGTLRKRRNR